MAALLFSSGLGGLGATMYLNKIKTEITNFWEKSFPNLAFPALVASYILVFSTFTLIASANIKHVTLELTNLCIYIFFMQTVVLGLGILNLVGYFLPIESIADILGLITGITSWYVALFIIIIINHYYCIVGILVYSQL